MKCEKCGKHITTVEINEFQRDGSDCYRDVLIEDYQDGVVELETNQDWTGYDLTEEEQAETILCPCCGEFPFKDKEIHAYEIVRVVCFKEGSK